MTKKRMEYCEVISNLIPYDWFDSPIDADARVGTTNELIDDAFIPPAHRIKAYERAEKVRQDTYTFDFEVFKEPPTTYGYFEHPDKRKRACIYYGTEGYVKKFEVDSNGNTLFFASALDAVNYLANKGWHLDKTFKSRSIARRGYGDYYIFEHWIMAREIEE